MRRSVTGNSGRALAALAMMPLCFTLPSCATPAPLEVALKAGEPVYRCTLRYELGWREAEFDGYFRPDGSEVQTPWARDYISPEEPELAAQLSAEFRRLASEPARNSTPWSAATYFWRQHRFDCTLEWSRGDEHFRVTPDYVSWRMQEGDRSVLSFGWTTSGRTDFATDGFPWQDTVGPVLFVERPADWGASNSRRYDKKGAIISDNNHEKGEVRAGAKYYRAWSYSNVALTIPWPVWPQLHEARADIVITISDQDLQKSQQWTLPSDFPRAIERELQTAYARQLMRARDPVNQCKRVDENIGPDIIVY